MQAKLRHAQTSFLTGEFSPLMAARSELPAWKGGSARLLNRRPLSQGGTTTRPAMRHFATLAANEAALIPFVFRSDQRYILVLSNGRLDAWAADGTACVPVTGCAWTSAMLADIGWCVAGDTILILHRTMAPQRIIRTGATAFTVAPMPMEVPAFTRILDTSITMSVTAVGAAGSAADFTFSAPVLTAGWVGRQIRWNQKRGLITAVADAQNGTLTWQDPTTGIALDATAIWAEQAWVPEYGYPGCGAILDGRLWLAASDAEPSAVWASRPGAFFNFDTAAGDDGDAIAESVGGLESVPRVRHLVPATRMLVMTDTGVWFVPSSSSSPVTPKTVAMRQVNEVGVLPTRPALNDGAVLYVDATGRTVREARYTFTLESFTADAISLMSEHLIQTPVSVSAVLGSVTQPGRLAVMANEDGGMAVLHSISSERVLAWVPWETAGKVKAVCGVQSSLFFVVDRGGAWRLEIMDEDRAPLDAMARATSMIKTRTFLGFGHLAGRTVGVVSHGHDLGDVVVADDGTITLGDDRPAVYEIEAGLRFQQVIRPLPVDADLQDGPATPLMKRLIRAHVQVHDSGPIMVDGRPVLPAFQGDDFDMPAPSFTGTYEVREVGIGRGCQFDITVPTASKVTVLALWREVQING